jgi:hypothetical protein
MIDATKLIDRERYYIRTAIYDWIPVVWNEKRQWFCDTDESFRLSEVTAAIPIPSPDTLAEMWEVIGDVADGEIEETWEGYNVLGIDKSLRETARTLLEKRV